MWRLVPTDEYERRFKRYAKKKRPQLNAVLNNLQRFVDLLNTGRQLRPLAFGFLRDEGHGVLRIGEAGAGPNVAATRLYVHPDADNETLYLLTIGDKSTQHEDIHLCARFVAQIRDDPTYGETRDDGHAQEEGGEEPEAPQAG